MQSLLSPRQEIRFARGHDDVRLAYALAGRGPLLIKAATWLSHLEFDWDSPIWGHMVRALSDHATFARYDERGCGLSDQQVDDLSFESRVRDLETVVAAMGAERFALLGISHGAPVAIAYAARHPERVSHLVIHGGYARGWLAPSRTPQQREEAELMIRFAEVGWRRGNPAYHQFFSSQFIPGGTPEQHQWLNELKRVSTTPSNAARFMRAVSTVDVSDLLSQIRCPTLVLHSMHDRRQPSEEGRLLATGIEGARFVPLQSSNHLPLEGEAGWAQWIEAVSSFLPAAPPANDPLFDTLTGRQRELVELLAQGRDNAQIAATLGLAEKTVRNHLTSVFAKLEVDNRGRAIVLARDSGFGRLQV